MNIYQTEQEIRSLTKSRDDVLRVTNRMITILGIYDEEAVQIKQAGERLIVILSKAINRRAT